MAGFENYLAQMIIKPRKCVLCENHVATSKVKFTVRTYSLCIGLNETYSCLAHNFVVWPASDMVRCKDLVFYRFVRSHQRAILLKALGGGISVLWTHFYSSFQFGITPIKCRSRSLTSQSTLFYQRIYSRTALARTLMARLPRLSRTRS